MNKRDFINYMQNPQSLSDATLRDLDMMVREYPYFQTAHLLLLKNLHNTENIKFSNQLKISSVFVSDRKVLFNLLFHAHEIAKRVDEKPIQKEIIQIVENKPAVENKINENKNLSTESVSSSKFKQAAKKDELYDIIHSPQIAYDILGNESQSDTFARKKDLNEVKISENQIITSSESQEPTKLPATKSNNDLISDFLTKKPAAIRIKPSANQGVEMPKSSEEDSDEFITETLAKIYIKQGYWQKAINAYQKLSLKYPEKNIYFANQIEQVKRMSEQSGN